MFLRDRTDIAGPGPCFAAIQGLRDVITDCYIGLSILYHADGNNYMYLNGITGPGSYKSREGQK